MMHLARSLSQGAMNAGACNEVTEFTADQADHKRITVTHSWLEGSRKKVASNRHHHMVAEPLTAHITDKRVSGRSADRMENAR